MFNNLRELIATMPDEKTCRDYLAAQRWNGKVVCPYCKHEKCYSIEKGARWKCADSKCYKRFTVTVGTFFEASNIPLHKWFPAIYIAISHKKGISSYQLGRDIGVTQKTAWFMLHRIREGVRTKEDVMLGENAPVEADETFVGGKYSNMHPAKRKKMLENGDGFTNKTTVLGMIERGGTLVAKVIPKGQPYKIAVTVGETVIKKATLITDSTNVYQKVISSYNHLSVNHSINQYVQDNTHTNTIEGAFSHFKRMIYGIYHQISAKHTQRYCNEFAHRYNTRKLHDADRFNIALTKTECRLRYKALVAPKEAPETMQLTAKPVNRNKGVFQLKDGELLGQYTSALDAQNKTGINRSNIYNTCKGKRTEAGGYDWIFA